MSGGFLLLLGAVLCFAGAWSARVAVAAGGAAVAWLLAGAFGASAGISLLIAVSGAVGAFVVALLFSRFLLFLTGLVIGGVIGARLFILLGSEGERGNWLLAVILVPAFALLCGFLAQRWHRGFIVWGTALGGAGLILAGLGRLDTDLTDFLWHPDTTGESVIQLAAWVGLTLVGRTVQLRVGRGNG
jgi:hypothetical protein